MNRKIELLLRIAIAGAVTAVFILFIEALRMLVGDQVAYYVGVFILLTAFFYGLYR